MENYPRWAEKHGVNCYFCGFLVDERDCTNADNYNNNDGGSICQNCLKELEDSHLKAIEYNPYNEKYIK